MPQMSTDGTNPTDPTPAAPEQTPATETPQPTTTEPATSEGTLASVESTEAEPGFIARHTTTLITVMVAVIIAAVAIAGVSMYRHNVDQKNSDTAAAFTKTVAAQGATLETVECGGDTCAAVINGQAYTVLVQKDAKGKQHFGVSAYAGD
jgi:uncharacterized protein HemX